jgi:hypothetical protein
MTVGDVSTSVKGIFQQQAKTVAKLCAASRPDLTVRRGNHPFIFHPGVFLRKCAFRF